MEEGDGEDQFLGNEAISAVADEGFLVDEEEDDYEDLYNDVNVGGVFQTFNREEDGEVGFRDQGDEKKVEGFSREEEKGDTKTEVGSLEVEQSPVVESGSIVGGGGRGMRVEFADSSIRMAESEGESQIRNTTVPVQPPQESKEGVGRQGVVNGGIGSRGGSGVGNGNGGGGTMLFVGDLHWWTTDAELETELCKYGHVKEVNFFDEKASGKSKGYCQVEFYDASAATACKEGMNGHVFNGKPCVVQYASPFSIKRMGEAQVNKNQAMVQSNSNFPPGRRGMGDGGNGGGRGGGNNMPMGGGYQGGDGNRSYGRGNWGRGNGQGMGGRGQGGPMRNRGGMSGGRGMMGNGGGNGFGQGMAPNPHMMHTQSMMGQGFDPAYGPNMGRMGGYGAFPVGPAPHFSGMMPSFPPVGGISMPGVAPHMNPAFFGRGMPTNGMGMMPPTGMDGHGMGMWSDPNSSGWGGEEPGGRVAESSYGEDATSEYGDANHGRGGRPNPMKEKDRMSERDWSGPNRKYWDDRDPESDRDIPREKDGLGGRELSRERERARDRDRDRGRDSYRYKEDIDPDRDHYREDRDQDRDRYRDDRERYMDPHRYNDRGPEYDTVDHCRYKDRELEYDDEWERGRSSRVYGKPHLSYEEEHPARSRDIEYSKRRRLPSE